MTAHRQFVIAACASALALGFAACATADGTVGDVDAGGQDEAGGNNTPDAGPKPLKKDAGSSGGDTDSGDPGNQDASVCTKAPPSNKCGVAPQCGCAPTETCDVQSNAGDVDCISAGTAAPGKACTTTAGCALGSTCIGGACKPYCPAGISPTGGDGGGGACGIKGTSTCEQITNAGKPVPNFAVCRIACDLVNATSCDVPSAPAGVVGCDLDNTNQPDCFTAGSSTTTCAGATRCAPAYVCVNLANDGGSSCKKWCKVGDSTPCGAGKCGGFGTPLLVNGVEYGACP